jgi:hypothetical protein
MRLIFTLTVLAALATGAAQSRAANLPIKSPPVHSASGSALPGSGISWGAVYGITALGCAVVYPMIATAVLNRPLTPREAYDGIANCVLPFIGGWIMDAWLPHTAWIDGTAPAAPPHHLRHHH